MTDTDATSKKRKGRTSEAAAHRATSDESAAAERAPVTAEAAPEAPAAAPEAPAAAPQPAGQAPTLAPGPGRKLDPNQSQITASRNFTGWLSSQRCGLAMTCYQTGWVCLLGVLPDGRLSLCVENFTRAMGVTGNRDVLYVGSLTQLWRLANVLGPTDRANEHFDRLYMPRASQTLGDVDIHEVGIDKVGRVIFVNTKFSCLATVSPTYGFTPIWKPPFISRLAAE